MCSLLLILLSGLWFVSMIILVDGDLVVRVRERSDCWILNAKSCSDFLGIF